MQSTDSTSAVVPWHGRLWLRLTALAALLVVVNVLGGRLMMAAERLLMPWVDAYGTVALLPVLGVYVVAMALPYVPAMEISLTLLYLLGAEGVPLVYGSTLLALWLSFAVGHLIPPGWIALCARRIGLRRTEALLRRLEPLDADGRLALLTAAAPARLLPLLLRHRYLALGVALNLPGNALLGGGGGIALAAGASGLFRPILYGFAVALAIAPIPLLVLLSAQW